MRRSVAVAWHASFFVLAGALYFFFVLPRWYELLDYWTPALGNPLRIVDGVLLGLCALPVVFTLQRVRRPEFGTPRLALSLLLWSIVLQVLAGVLVVGTAVSEYWLDLDTKGQWLFGVYGAAAAVAVLGALGFYLAFLAELPPPPPRPLKVKSTRRGRKDAGEAKEAQAATEPEGTDELDADAADAPESPAVEETSADPETPEEAAPDVTETPASTDTPSDAEAEPGEAGGKLRNRRPADKSTSRRFGRRRGGVALDD